MQLLPISCLRPTAAAVADFAALPYDVYSRAEAKAEVAAHPKSFLAIDRPETAFSDDVDMYSEAVYSKAAELLNAAIADGTLIEDSTPAYYLYRLEQAGHAQTGIVCSFSVEDYQRGTICRHENTTRAKEEDRVQHIRHTAAQTGPIFLAHKDKSEVTALIKHYTETLTPIYDFCDSTGCAQKVWRLAEPAQIEAIQAEFSQLDAAYIADGHHRAASAVRVAQELSEKNPDNKAASQVLAVIFSASELEILPYNRLVKDLGDYSPESFIEALKSKGFSLQKLAAFEKPEHKGSFCLYLNHSWYKVSFPEANDNSNGGVLLDTERLQNLVFDELFGIVDPRSDDRLSFVGASVDAVGLAALAEGVGGLTFWLYPTSMEELFAISDAKKLMPPKSTWFEPKLRSGLFIRKLN